MRNINSSLFSILLLLCCLPLSTFGKEYVKESKQFNCVIEDLTLNCSTNYPPLIVQWLDDATLAYRNELGSDWLISNDYNGIAPAAVCNVLEGGKRIIFTATNSNGDQQTCETYLTIIDDVVVIDQCPVEDLILSASDNNVDPEINVWLKENEIALKLAAGNEDGCDGPGEITITNDYGGVTPSQPCDGNNDGLVVTFTATDECGNTATCTGNITILNDNDPPLLDCSNLRNSTVCNIRQASLGVPTASDDQTPSDQISITYEDDDSNVAPCYASGTLLRTWTATDLCGNTSTCVQSIRISNLGLVSGCSLGSGEVIKCKAGENLRQRLIDWDAGKKNFLSRCANNSCINAVTVTSSFDPNLIPEECISLPERRVFYTIRDECGRTASKVASFTVLKTTDPICDNIEVLGDNNQLTINNLTEPNIHVKILDKDYKIINECIGDCGESVVFPNLMSGEIYRTNIQVYDGNWQLICDNFQEVIIEGSSEPCDTSICQGDIRFRTQAEVDAFCGCEIVEGEISLIAEGEFGSPSDISDLSNLSQLKEIKGQLIVVNTAISDFSALENLTTIGQNLVLNGNTRLTSLAGLEKLEFIGGGLILESNEILENLDGLQGLKFVSNLVFINNLKDIKQVQNWPIRKLKGLNIVNCNELETLDGLNKLDSITRLNTDGGNVTIGGNDNLVDISALKNLQFIKGDFLLDFNRQLADCCGIQQLIDDNLDNGRVQGEVVITRNLTECSAVNNILENCQEQSTSCQDIQINTNNNRIILSNLAESPNEIIKIFDKDYNIVYECVTNCVEKQQLVSAYPDGTYIVDIQLYDENWQNICSEQRTIILENTNPCNTNPCENTPPVLANIPADITVECDNIPNFPDNVTATDNCDTSVDINLEETRTDGACQDNYVLTRTWTAIDDCGNSTAGIQVIVVEDTTEPVLSNVPADMTVNSFAEVTDEGIENVRATDNCDADVQVTFDETRVGDATLTRTWTATDNCGNTASTIQTITISDEIEVTSCDDISLESFDNQLTISILNAPNTLVKVFDNDWQLVFNCTDNCEQILIFEDLQIGDVYHLDAQFYDENWQLICSKKADKRIGSDTEPCPDPICQGNITLANQAEVDAFCGCEVIDGVLTIGNPGAMNDITDLSNLSNLKEVVGGITIRNTPLKDLSGLNKLEELNGLALFDNLDLTSLSGLESLTVATSVFIRTSPILANLNGLSGLKSIQFINIFNIGIRDLSGFQNLEDATIKSLVITNCNRLTSLKGIETLSRVMNSSTSGSIFIADNDILTDISALSNIEMIAGSLVIRDNIRLQDCCPITHLIDEDLTNGIVQNDIIINNNPFVCGSVSIVVEECQDAEIDRCAAIQIERQPNQLTLSNIDAPNAIVKVFDENYGIVYECIGDCEETITVDNLNADEVYHLDIQLYDRNWESICNLVETLSPSAEDRTNQLQPIDFSIAPNPAQSEILVDLNRLEGTTVSLQLQNQFGQIILEKRIEKATRQPEKIDLSKVSNGLYFLQIQAKGKKAIGKKLIVNKLY